MKRNLTEGNVTKSLLLFAGPMILGNLMQPFVSEKIPGKRELMENGLLIILFRVIITSDSIKNKQTKVWRIQYVK